MKRWVILLLVLGLTLPMAAPAAAKKGGKPGPPRPAGQTCAERGGGDPSWTIGYVDGDDDGAFTKTNSVPANFIQFCIDVNNVDEATWTGTVTSDAKLRWLLIIPRDSVAPGDDCGHEPRARNVTFYRYSLDMPASDIDACGDEYPDSGTGFADEAFALLVFAQVERNSAATVTLTLNDLPPKTTP